MARVGLFFLVVVATAGAFTARLVVVPLTRRRWPRVAAAVDRWWPWTPMVVVCLFLIWNAPVVGVAATIGTLFALTRAEARASPFRPRR